MRRGDLVVVAQRGLYEGKPRPAVVIQADPLVDVHPSILVCQLSSDGRASNGAFYRLVVEPSRENGLRERSTILADRIVTMDRGNMRDVIGRLDAATLSALNRALALFQGLL